MATLEFLERNEDGKLGDTLVIVEAECLACLEGDDIEIDGREYAVLHIHTIVASGSSPASVASVKHPASITYQIHVRLNREHRRNKDN